MRNLIKKTTSMILVLILASAFVTVTNAMAEESAEDSHCFVCAPRWWPTCEDGVCNFGETTLNTDENWRERSCADCGWQDVFPPDGDASACEDICYFYGRHIDWSIRSCGYCGWQEFGVHVDTNWCGDEQFCMLTEWEHWVNFGREREGRTCLRCRWFEHRFADVNARCSENDSQCNFNEWFDLRIGSEERECLDCSWHQERPNYTTAPWCVDEHTTRRWIDSGQGWWYMLCSTCGMEERACDMGDCFDEMVLTREGYWVCTQDPSHRFKYDIGEESDADGLSMPDIAVFDEGEEVTVATSLDYHYYYDYYDYDGLRGMWFMRNEYLCPDINDDQHQVLIFSSGESHAGAEDGGFLNFHVFSGPGVEASVTDIGGYWWVNANRLSLQFFTPRYSLQRAWFASSLREIEYEIYEVNLIFEIDDRGLTLTSEDGITVRYRRNHVDCCCDEEDYYNYYNGYNGYDEYDGYDYQDEPVSAPEYSPPQTPAEDESSEICYFCGRVLTIETPWKEFWQEEELLPQEPIEE